MTAEFHQRYSQPAITRAIALTADVYEPSREWAAEHGRPEWANDPHYTIGALLGTVQGLLDALGYPEHGPNIVQHSWLPEPDDADDEEVPR